MVGTASVPTPTQAVCWFYLSQLQTPLCPDSFIGLSQRGITAPFIISIHHPFAKAVLLCYCFTPILARSYMATENQLPRLPMAELNMLVLQEKQHHMAVV